MQWLSFARWHTSFYENIKTCDVTFTSQEDQISIFPSSSLCETRLVEMIAKSGRSEKRQPKRVNLLSFVNFRCRFRSAYLSYLIADCEPDPGFPRITS